MATGALLPGLVPASVLSLALSSPDVHAAASTTAVATSATLPRTVAPS